MGCKPVNTPMKANVDLWFDDSYTLDDPGRYKRLIEKLIYLTVTRPDITFAVGVRVDSCISPGDSLVSCNKSSGLYQELSQERVGIQKTWACTHFWVLGFRVCC